MLNVWKTQFIALTPSTTGQTQMILKSFQEVHFEMCQKESFTLMFVSKGCKGQKSSPSCGIEGRGGSPSSCPTWSAECLSDLWKEREGELRVERENCDRRTSVLNNVFNQKASFLSSVLLNNTTTTFAVLFAAWVFFFFFEMSQFK